MLPLHQSRKYLNQSTLTHFCPGSFVLLLFHQVVEITGLEPVQLVLHTSTLPIELYLLMRSYSDSNRSSSFCRAEAKPLTHRTIRSKNRPRTCNLSFTKALLYPLELFWNVSRWGIPRSRPHASKARNLPLIYI